MSGTPVKVWGTSKPAKETLHQFCKAACRAPRNHAMSVSGKGEQQDTRQTADQMERGFNEGAWLTKARLIFERGLG